MAKEPFTLGQRDPQVKELQKFLNQAGYPLAKTGPGASGFETDYYGPLTQSATQKFLASGGNLPLVNPQTGAIEPLPYKPPVQQQFVPTIDVLRGKPPKPTIDLLKLGEITSTPDTRLTQPVLPQQQPQFGTQTPQQPQINASLAPDTIPPQAPTTTQPTADDIAAALMAKLGYSGTQETPESKRQAYLDFITGQQKTFGEQLGIPGKEALAKPIEEQIAKTNQMLDDLERNINERVKGFGAGEAWRQRLLASERQPLTRQLSELGRAYAPVTGELSTARQKLTEMMGLSKEAFEYGQQKTPQQKLAEKIAEQQALQTIEPPKYTSVSPGETIYDPKTGKEIYRAPAKEPSISEKYGTGAIGEYNFYAEQEKKVGRTPLSFDAYQTMDANRKAKITAAANASGLDWKTTNYIEGISKAFDSSPIVKNFNEVQNKFYSVKNIIDAGVGGPGDLALVFEFMKSLDPTSVVRESEYDVASKSGNIFKGWAAKFNGYLKEEGGFLPENVKKSFLNIVGIKFNAIQSQYNNLRGEKARQINLTTGVSDAEKYLVNYNFDLGLGKEKEIYTIDDVKEDIQNSADKYNYNFGREQMIEDLFALYSPYGITKQEIIGQVYPITNKLWGKK